MNDSNFIKPDYNSPVSIKTFLEQNNMAMQKKFGQNFLINASARKKIIDSLDVKEGTSVWEVGPGLGCMTDELLKRGAIVTVFEIDKGFAASLKTFFSSFINEGKLKIVEGDVIKTWKKEYADFGQPERFFGNLPYNIAATLIAETIEKNVRFEKAVFTVQKEVALRACAKPGSKDYSSFSILCQWAYNLRTICDLSGSNFWPRPNVDSRAFSMTKTENFPNCKNPSHFVKMQRALFSSRRKTVKNNLTQFLSSSQKAEQALNQAKIPLTERAENLPIEKLLLLSDIIV